MRIEAAGMCRSGCPRAPSLVQRMADALTIYNVDLSHTPAVHLALFRAGFGYSQVRNDIDRAVAAAKARAGRR